MISQNSGYTAPSGIKQMRNPGSACTDLIKLTTKISGHILNIYVIAFKN
jgi:hypothetical protein